MKIGILSMQKVNNFGSLLQAYGLKKMITEVKADSDIYYVDIVSKDEDKSIAATSILYKEELDSTYSSKFDCYLFYRIKNKIAVKKQNELFHAFRDEILACNSDYERLDICIIGSDEVFNACNPSPWGFTTQLFGNIDNAERICTYAASCGFTSIKMLNSAMKERIKDAFKKVSMFSVRDENTHQFVKALTKHDIAFHLDPVLVSDFSEEIAAAARHLEVKENLCIVYSYHNRIHKKEEIYQIKKFAKRHGYQLISIGAPQKWISNMVPISPFEMLVTISKAAFVITDTFHGTIFASKYNGKFATIVRESNCNKLADLVERLHIKDHVINSFDDLEKTFSAQNTIEGVEQIVQIEREKSLKYLSKVICVE